MVKNGAEIRTTFLLCWEKISSAKKRNRARKSNLFLLPFSPQFLSPLSVAHCRWRRLHPFSSLFILRAIPSPTNELLSNCPDDDERTKLKPESPSRRFFSQVHLFRTEEPALVGVVVVIHP